MIAAGFARTTPSGHGKARVPAPAAPLARHAPTATPQMTSQRGSKIQDCRSRPTTKPGSTDRRILQPLLDVPGGTRGKCKATPLRYPPPVLAQAGREGPE
jgi:hypothetical protein